MANIIEDEFKNYLKSLSSTASICAVLGTRLVASTNLFVGIEPQATKCVTIIAYGGAPPDVDGYKYESYVQIIVKNPKRKIARTLMQSIINTFHMNDMICSTNNGMVYALQSAPISLGVRDGGEVALCEANFRVKHIKL